MNQSMDTLHIMAGIAIYKTNGVIAAITYLMTELVISFDEAADIIATYDRYEDAAKAGTIH